LITYFLLVVQFTSTGDGSTSTDAINSTVLINSTFSS